MSEWRWPTPNGLPPLQAVMVLAILAAGLLGTAPVVEISAARLIKAWGPATDFLGHLLIVPSLEYLPQLGAKMLETVEITVLATAIATALSLPLGILAARNASPHPVVFHGVRGLLSFVRALPELVWALMFVSAVGLGPLAGVMALAFVTVGFMGKFIAEGIEVVGEKAIEGVRATGGQRLQVIMFAILPQAVPDLIGTLLYILDHNLRAAAILGLVGAGGIGYDMVMAMRLFDYDRIILIALAIYALVTVLDRASDLLRRRAIGRVFNVGQ